MSAPEYHASIATMLRHHAAERPDAIAVAVEGHRSLTFGEWEERSRRFAAGLRAVSGPSGRVGFVGKDVTLWAEAWGGASLNRGAGIPLNWRLARPELDAVLRDAEVSVLVVESDFLPLVGRERSAGASEEQAWVIIGEGPALPYESWLAEHHGEGLVADQPNPDDIALLIYTSGTSGVPKGVELSNRAIAANLALPAPWDITAGDVVMVPAPIFHLSGSGWLFYCLALGASSLYLLDIDPGAVLRLFAGGRVNHALTVPAVVQMLVQHPDARSSRYDALRTLIYGGSPMSPAVATAAQDVFDCDLVQSYGMTETCGPITFLGPDEHRAGGALLASAGLCVAGVELGVFDPTDGRRCDVGETGEVWTRSDLLLSGYRNRPGELAAVLRPDGWFRTGDAGCLDDDGYLFLQDRVKDMIVSGGENIYPVEIENVLMEHESIRDAAVIGVPHDRWGETVKAIVVAEGATERELIEHCRAFLARYKCPTSIEFVDDLPRNPSGKLLKRELRAPYWADRSRGIA